MIISFAVCDVCSETSLLALFDSAREEKSSPSASPRVSGETRVWKVLDGSRRVSRSQGVEFLKTLMGPMGYADATLSDTPGPDHGVCLPDASERRELATASPSAARGRA